MNTIPPVPILFLVIIEIVFIVVFVLSETVFPLKTDNE